MGGNPFRTAADIETTAVSTALPAVLAILIGVFLVWGTAFAYPTTIHNAAHDSRHALAFPCH
jgi:cobalt transporter subunit CbtB